MSRTLGRIVVLVAAFSLLAGLAVPAGAAPRPTKPVWTLTQETDASNRHLVTLQGLIPADARANYYFDLQFVLGSQCVSLYDCVYSSIAPVQLNGVSPKQTQQALGWTLTAELSRSGVTVRLVLEENFLPGRRYVQVAVQGTSSVPGFPDIETGTSINEAFGEGGGGSGAALEALQLLKGDSAGVPLVSWARGLKTPPPPSDWRFHDRSLEGLSLASLLLIGLVSSRKR